MKSFKCPAPDNNCDYLGKSLNCHHSCIEALLAKLNQSPTPPQDLREAVKNHIKWLEGELGDWICVNPCNYPTHYLIGVREELDKLEVALAGKENDNV